MPKKPFHTFAVVVVTSFALFTGAALFTIVSNPAEVIKGEDGETAMVVAEESESSKSIVQLEDLVEKKIYEVTVKDARTIKIPKISRASTISSEKVVVEAIQPTEAVGKKSPSQAVVEPVAQEVETSIISGQTHTFQATSYDLSINSCGKGLNHPQYGVTRSGYSLKGMSRTEAMSIAVDPNVIPLGTVVYVEFSEPYEHFTGHYTARDTGGAIKGKIIDVFMGDFQKQESDQSVWDFGRREVKITY